MPLWIDEPNALGKLRSMHLDDETAICIRSLIEDGLAVVRGANPAECCDAVISDYEKWSQENASYVQKNLDHMGRPKRLVNFHLYSKNALAIGTNEKIHRILDVVFNLRSSLYTSLTFKFGTQQPVHRDSPHFATWPEDHFIGVWTALEDVAHDAGPLFYHKRGHRLDIVDPREFLTQASARTSAASMSERLALALDLYNGEVIRKSESFVSPTLVEPRKGDTVLWHPRLPHGGAKADDQMRTRWSIVCHCAPESIQVYQHDQFFQHVGPKPPPQRYGFRKAGHRQVALAGEVAFM